jgi:hypothetical protein
MGDETRRKFPARGRRGRYGERALISSLDRISSSRFGSAQAAILHLPVQKQVPGESMATKAGDWRCCPRSIRLPRKVFGVAAPVPDSQTPEAAQC